MSFFSVEWVESYSNYTQHLLRKGVFCSRSVVIIEKESRKGEESDLLIPSEYENFFEKNMKPECGLPCVSRLLQIAKSRFPEHFNSDQRLEQVTLALLAWPRKKQMSLAVEFFLALVSGFT